MLANKIKDIKKLHLKSFNSLKMKENELSRIIDKNKRYYVDVELDQIMTCFKISFANICSFLVQECFANENMNLQNLFESIFDLHGKVKEEGNQRKILINRNLKEIKVMEKLRHVFNVINSMQIKNLGGSVYNFNLV